MAQDAVTYIRCLFLMGTMTAMPFGSSAEQTAFGAVYSVQLHRKPKFSGVR